MKIEKREFRSNALALMRTKVSENNSDLLLVEGYGCHFGVPNGNDEEVKETSFADFFDQLRNGGQMPYFNFQHDANLIIGGWDEIVADERGLYCKGHINKKVAIVRDTVLPLIESGDLSGLSTEGYSMGWYDRDTNIWHAEKFILLGISLVSLPADFGAQMVVKNSMLLREAHREDEMTKVIFM